MLGRKSYTRRELDNARAALSDQLAAYTELVQTLPGDGAQDAHNARAAFDERFFNNMTIVLDRYFVHRLRSVTGKDANALNEVEMLSDSLMNNDGVLKASTVIKYVGDRSVVGIAIGDPIVVGQHGFERLAEAFFADLERKFL